MQQPNVIIIMPDQLRRQALGCYGDPNVQTPNIDRLAAGGVRFGAACSTYAVCVPFRFSFMTGQYAHTRFIPALTWRMSPAERTLADEFNDAGYHTVYCGKWHLEGSSSHLPIPRSRQGRWRKWLGFELRNAHFDTFYFEDDDPTPKPIGKYQTDGLFELLMDHLRSAERPANKPFCCVLSPEPPHFPYEAPDLFLDRLRNRTLEMPPSFQRELEYDVPLSHWEGDETHTTEIKLDRVRTYYAMIENLDWNIGRLQAFLEEQDMGRTIVILISDHGEMGGMHGLPTAMKVYPFEEAIAFPFIVYDSSRPDIAGRMIDDPVCTEDLYPSICGLAGITPRAELPGLNLTPLIYGECEQLGRNGILLEAVHDFRPCGAFFQHQYRGIRTKQWKYTVLAGSRGTQPWQLFDLERDPFEMHNLIAEHALREKVCALHEELRRMLKETDDHFVLSPFADTDEQDAYEGPAADTQIVKSRKQR